MFICCLLGIDFYLARLLEALGLNRSIRHLNIGQNFEGKGRLVVYDVVKSTSERILYIEFGQQNYRAISINNDTPTLAHVLCVHVHVHVYLHMIIS